MESLLKLAMQNILHSIEEGIHIIDAEGRSILYNKKMEHIEGLSASEVLGKHLLEVYPAWTIKDSTLLTALETGRTIERCKQSYLNFKNKRITTVNTTYPILSGAKIVGAVEIARNYTEVNALSEKLIDLQQKMTTATKSRSSKQCVYTFDMLVGRNPGFMKAIEISRKAAKADSNILIEGETGTGKELFAQSIHNECAGREGLFVAVNCAAIPDTLLEGILFGTSKGSYTGAEERPGLFEQANGGTLFLDEINSMSLPLQAKILRVLQENYLRRLGGTRDLPIDVRIIASSNEPLQGMMKSGEFRKDLYYRLNVINIQIPPLRERKEDIPLLTDYFLRYYNKKMGKDVWMLSLELQEAFLDYPWNGNIRELQNVIESAMTMVTDENVLEREHLPAHIDLLRDAPPQAVPNAEGLEPGPSFSAWGNLSVYLDDIERKIINDALRRSKANISQAAAMLGMSRQNLQYKMKRYALTGSS